MSSSVAGRGNILQVSNISDTHVVTMTDCPTGLRFHEGDTNLHTPV